MSSVFIRHHVKDFGKWKPFFDEHEPTRRAHGITGHSLYNDTGDPNGITILFRVADLKRAKEFVASQDLRSVMERAGVEGPPEIWYVDDLEDKRYP